MKSHFENFNLPTPSASSEELEKAQQAVDAWVQATKEGRSSPTNSNSIAAKSLQELEREFMRPKPNLESSFAPSPNQLAKGNDSFGNIQYHICAVPTIEQPAYNQDVKKAIDAWIQAEKESRSNPT